MCGPTLQVGLDKESDQTGDSGKGTGSGTTEREEWIRNPPPGVCIALHTLVCFEGWIFCCIEPREHHYQSLLTDSTKEGMGLFAASYTTLCIFCLTFLQMNRMMT